MEDVISTTNIELKSVNKVEVKSTQDYEIFKFVLSNREVNEPHVKKLMRSISEKNLLSLNPIIVNSRFEVIDGQHRLEAATRLKVPVYYIVSDLIGKADIARLNSDKSNWKPDDYINYYTLEGVPSYIELTKFLNKYRQIRVTTALSLFSKDESHQRGGYKDGNIDITNAKGAYEIAAILNSFRDYCNFSFDRTFIAAIRQIYETGVYDHAVMMKKISLQPRSFVKCVTSKQYVEMLEEIYNWRSSTNRVRFF